VTSVHNAISESLALHARQRGDETAMRSGSTTLTWAELHRQTSELAQRLPAGRLGLYGQSDCAWAIAYLAAILAGRTLVPIPDFFSSAQCEHIIRRAGLSAILTTSNTAGLTGIATAKIVDLNSLGRACPFRDAAGQLHDGSGDNTQAPPLSGHDAVIVFTSGSTGQPKGVRLTLENLLSTATALVVAADISSRDSYLSVLPLSMLLEQVCALLIPVLTGAPVTFDPELAARVMAGQALDIAAAVACVKPTVMVLVPQLLQLLVSQLQQKNINAKEIGLRFVAVGGASTSSTLLAQARALGVPAYEGYGLTECASVVTLNTPDCNRSGTVGRPLAGRHIEIVDGEIVVSGTSVMTGYLGAQNLREGRWQTGDIGEVNADGQLIVHGRKDNLIVCANGRNVSPEWVENAILNAPDVHGSIVCPHEQTGGLAALLVTSWPATSSDRRVAALSQRLSDTLPHYACPQAFTSLSPAEAANRGLFRMGKPDRRLARAILLDQQNFPSIKEPTMSPYDRLLSATAADREAFLRIPLIQNAISNGTSAAMYLAFLSEAYHHVKHTFPLLALAASRTNDAHLRQALAEYMKEEFGHEEWILEDIARMGGNAAAVAASKPRLPCRTMVAYNYYAIEHETPYAVLGMVHVLEGLSVLLADKIAGALKKRFGMSSEDGFTYLKTHGALDVEHTAMFQRLIDGFQDPAVVDIVIDNTRAMYRLYGAIFEDLGQIEQRSAA